MNFIIEYQGEITIDDVVVGDLLYIQTYTKPTEKEFIIGVTNITDKTISAVVYDGPVFKKTISAKTIRDNKDSEPRKFMKNTIEQIKYVNLVSEED